MSNERENLYQPLTYTDYDIAGNVFRAYYDVDKKLVMVLDFVISDVKPNVLLVINPIGDRKWDDILQNDYAVDLETIRPKKDNKYQKLDIEYTGLAEYDNLVRAYVAGDDLTDELEELSSFRNGAARRAALERLGAADIIAERARETIEKTNETINSQQIRLKNLRGKLTEQRRDVGKEPTKQSAAKILRTESQIDATNDKLGRAKKRLVSAQHRLDAATEDAETAREILVRLDNVFDGENLPTTPITTDVAEFDEPSVPMAQAPQFTEIATYEQPMPQEPKAEEMADDEVKPLFDKDPEILDEDIAFKPIDFNLPSETVAPTGEMVPAYSEPGPVAPLNFVPPVQSQPVMPGAIEPVVSPVLDSLTAVEAPSEGIDSELLASIAPTPEPQEFMAPIPEAIPSQMPQTTEMSEQVAPSTMDVLPSQGVVSNAPMPEISPAPIDTGMRPVSPITGDASETVTPVQRKPTMLYYVMLVVLIVLSIFTLWMYQKSANESVPELGAQPKPVEEEVVVHACHQAVDVAALLLAQCEGHLGVRRVEAAQCLVELCGYVGRLAQGAVEVVCLRIGELVDPGQGEGQLHEEHTRGQSVLHRRDKLAHGSHRAAQEHGQSGAVHDGVLVVGLAAAVDGLLVVAVEDVVYEVAVLGAVGRDGGEQLLTHQERGVRLVALEAQHEVGRRGVGRDLQRAAQGLLRTLQPLGSTASCGLHLLAVGKVALEVLLVGLQVVVVLLQGLFALLDAAAVHRLEQRAQVADVTLTRTARAVVDDHHRRRHQALAMAHIAVGHHGTGEGKEGGGLRGLQEGCGIEVGHGGIVARQATDDLLGEGRQHLAAHIIAHEMGEVITVGNELREVLLYEA